MATTFNEEVTRIADVLQQKGYIGAPDSLSRQEFEQKLNEVISYNLQHPNFAIEDSSPNQVWDMIEVNGGELRLGNEPAEIKFLCTMWHLLNKVELDGVRVFMMRNGPYKFYIKPDSPLPECNELKKIVMREYNIPPGREQLREVKDADKSRGRKK